MATINDIVLIHLEDSPVSFARVEDIRPDHKKDWYQIKLLMLQIPLHVVTWILKDAYINGDDFYMGGKKMRLETVVCPEDDLPVPMDRDAPEKDQTDQDQTDQDHTDQDRLETSKGNIISFSDLKGGATQSNTRPSQDLDPDIG